MKIQTVVLAAAFALSAGAALADGDAKLGAAVFKKCMACHTATEAKNKVGPSLQGIIGRPVASAAGYAYSPAMKAFAEGGKVWDEATLASYLADPKGVVKGTKMSFAGLKQAADVANVIAYMKDPAAAK